MTTAPQISNALSRKDAHAQGKAGQNSGDVLLGEDWTVPADLVEPELRGHRGRRGIVALNRSPLARKIIIFNMMALVILVAGVLFMNPFRDSLVIQREQGLVTEA
jgi:two-component system sensor histidine kinase ChvG